MRTMGPNSRAEQELAACQDIWKGGYFEGDPLDPMGPSSYGLMGFMSARDLAYLRYIKPNVGPTTAILEIGPGRSSPGKQPQAFEEVKDARQLSRGVVKEVDASCGASQLDLPECSSMPLLCPVENASPRTGSSRF